RRGLFVSQRLISGDARAEEPDIVSIHRADRAEAVPANLPVDRSRTKAVGLGEAGRPEDDVVGAPDFEATFHLCADQLANLAARTVRTDQVARGYDDAAGLRLDDRANRSAVLRRLDEAGPEAKLD